LCFGTGLAKHRKKTGTMKTFVRTGLVAALCLAGTAAYGQEPGKTAAKPQKETTNPAARKANPPSSTPPKKLNPTTTTRPKTVKHAEPAKKIDFAPAK
jgi:hypothetical protein